MGTDSRINFLTNLLLGSVHLIRIRYWEQWRQILATLGGQYCPDGEIKKVI